MSGKCGAQLGLELADLPADAPQVPDMASQHRAALEARWVELTNRVLPAAAKTRGWPIHLNHCFQRVLLDNACGGVWYEHITGRPAYKHASEDLLAAAISLGEACLSGADDLAALNDKSLAWRGKSRR